MAGLKGWYGGKRDEGGIGMGMGTGRSTARGRRLLT